MKKMSFERFNYIGKLYKCKASISTRGVISIRQGACHRFNLDINNAKFAQLFYDKANRLIGIKFVAEEDGAVANTHGRTYSLDVPAKSMLDYYDIMPQKTSAYQCSQGDDGMIIIDMKTAKERQSKK